MQRLLRTEIWMESRMMPTRAPISREVCLRMDAPTVILTGLPMWAIPAPIPPACPPMAAPPPAQATAMGTGCSMPPMPAQTKLAHPSRMAALMQMAMA